MGYLLFFYIFTTSKVFYFKYKLYKYDNYKKNAYVTLF